MLWNYVEKLIYPQSSTAKISFFHKSLGEIGCLYFYVYGRYPQIPPPRRR
jgi:hypothetical protein